MRLKQSLSSIRKTPLDDAAENARKIYRLASTRITCVGCHLPPCAVGMLRVCNFNDVAPPPLKLFNDREQIDSPALCKPLLSVVAGFSDTSCDLGTPIAPEHSTAPLSSRQRFLGPLRDCAAFFFGHHCHDPDSETIGARHIIRPVLAFG